MLYSGPVALRHNGSNDREGRKISIPIWQVCQITGDPTTDGVDGFILGQDGQVLQIKATRNTAYFYVPDGDSYVRLLNKWEYSASPQDRNYFLCVTRVFTDETLEVARHTETR